MTAFRRFLSLASATALAAAVFLVARPASATTVRPLDGAIGTATTAGASRASGSASRSHQFFSASSRSSCRVRSPSPSNSRSNQLRSQ